MTSTVTVTAHCGSNKEVLVTRKHNAETMEQYVQDGDNTTLYIYDDVVVSAKEVLKGEKK